MLSTEMVSCLTSAGSGGSSAYAAVVEGTAHWVVAKAFACVSASMTAAHALLSSAIIRTAAHALASTATISVCSGRDVQGAFSVAISCGDAAVMTSCGDAGRAVAVW